MDAHSGAARDRYREQFFEVALSLNRSCFLNFDELKVVAVREVGSAR
jgi:hypothetical protein